MSSHLSIRDLKRDGKKQNIKENGAVIKPLVQQQIHKYVRRWKLLWLRENFWRDSTSATTVCKSYGRQAVSSYF